MMITFTLDSVSVAGSLSHPLSSKTSLSTFRQRSLSLSSSSPRSLSILLLRRRSCSTFVAFAATREELHSEELKAENEGDEGSQEEWKQALESFNERVLKMQSVSQEAYELYTKKATMLLQETSERLKIYEDKASQDLSAILNEISETENTLEAVKEIVETYTSSSEELTGG